MIQVQQDVLDFHKKFGCYTQSQPSLVDDATRKLRDRLIDEERQELQDAMDNKDLVEIADAAADLIYVILGTTLAYGIDMAPVWKEVQRSNMAKEGGGTRADGKILKPKDWAAPEISQIILNQICMRPLA